MRARNKCPGRALQRTAGAKEEIQMSANFQPQIYATGTDLQTRHVRRRCELNARRAMLIAALHFGKCGR
jgi:hypothetical protein